MTDKNLYEKLLEVKKSVSYFKKEQKGNQYNYVSSSQVLGSLRDTLNEQGVLLVPEIIAANVREKHEQKGDSKTTITYFTELDMRMKWVNVSNPAEVLECQWYGQGVDIAGEKGVGKALTYAEKYFMLKFFNIPTDKDDPDAFQNKFEHKEEKKMPDKVKGNIRELEVMFASSKSMIDVGKATNTAQNYEWTDEESKMLNMLRKNKLIDIKGEIGNG